MLTFFNRSLAGRLYALIALFSVFLVGIVSYQLATMRSNLDSFKRQEIRSVVQVATNLVAKYHGMAEAGELSEADAKAAAQRALSAIRYAKKDYVFVFDKDFINVAHPAKPEFVGTFKGDIRDGNGKYHIREMMAVAQAGGGYVQYAWKSPDGAILYKTSYAGYFEPWGWMLGSGVLMKDVDEIFWAEAIKTAVSSFVVVLICVGASVALAITITRPIKRLSADMGAITDGDVERMVHGVERGDEIGGMARAVKVFQSSLRERAELEARERAELAARERRQNALEHLIEHFEHDVNGTLTDASGNTQKLGEAATGLREIASQTEQGASVANSASAEASENVQTVAAAAEELLASIDDINNQVSESTAFVARATTSAQSSSDKIEGLDAAAQKIGEVVNLIQEIAEQTNLLALNATIEAARAGEAGKGFAVVASEVKDLANQTSKATDEISSQIGAIQGSTREAVDVIQEITSIMDQIGTYTEAISAAVQQQGAATAEISQSVQRAAEGTLSASTNMHTVSESATDTYRSAEVVNTAAEKMATSIGDMQSQVDKFLKDVAANA